VIVKQLNWGIIGCGNVTEKKSGPALYKTRKSTVIAVMRRDAEMAKDYSRRHKIKNWYSNSERIINHPDINAIYIATPPDTHADYAIQALEAGKIVLVEKPMALNYSQCHEMIKVAEETKIPLFVAYYRRSLPYFLKIKELISSGTIGEVRLVNLKLFYPPRPNDAHINYKPWRVKPQISGGGYLFDLGSHQLDMLDFLFGPLTITGSYVSNQGKLYEAEDIVLANFKFDGKILGTASWCFTVQEKSKIDFAEIIGSKGKIEFSFFDFIPIKLITANRIKKYKFRMPRHIHQPLIKTIADEMLGKASCPSTGYTAARTNLILDELVKDYYYK